MSFDPSDLPQNWYVDFYEHAPDMYALVEPETGEIKACNQTYAQSLGYDRETIVGAEQQTFVTEDSIETLERVRERLEDEDDVEHLEIEMERADGRSFPVSLSATALRESGELEAIRVFIRDISELKSTERRLRKQTEKLKRSNEQLEQFAYLASHDLQEPLRMVASYTQLLERRYQDELDEQARQYIEYAVEGAERMKRLIDDLLKYSRIGGPDVEFEPIDVDDLLDDVEANLKIKIAETDATIHRPDAPPVVHGDHSQLLQLFQNLIDNAIKFRGDETPEIEIDATRLEREDAHCFTVTDHGIGFDPENADRLFDIFQRLHERGTYEGTGAGLAIVQKIVDNHGGTIEVDSEPDRGTTFEIVLPRRET